jgi:long-chain acyl-CoA synthetase
MGVFEAVKQHNIEVLLMVPTMYAMMANAKSAAPELLKSIKLAVSGGEALPVTLIEQFREKFGVTLMEGFGLTETAPIVALSMPWAHKAGSVGQVIPNVQVKTVAEDGSDVPVGTDGGEVWIKGDCVMKGYYNKPDLTAEVITPDGWFKTGDIGRIDEEGYLYITGRKKDMIIMAGEKVFPREIEDAIKQHPAVLLVAVIGAKDEKRGEMPVAFVQLKPEAGAEGSGIAKPTENEIRSWVRERIAPYKTPRDVYFMEALPLGPTGKVLKRELKVPG